MDYRSVRNQIQDGDVLAFEGDSWFSAVIRLWTKSKITHVGFAVWVHDRLFVLEALEGKGVHLARLSVRLKSEGRIHWFLLPAECERGTVVDYALNQVGKRYASHWQFVRSYAWLTKRVCDWLKIPHDTNEDRFYCSELANSAMGRGDSARVPPSELVADLESPGAFECQT